MGILEGEDLSSKGVPLSGLDFDPANFDFDAGVFEEGERSVRSYNSNNQVGQIDGVTAESDPSADDVGTSDQAELTWHNDEQCRKVALGAPRVMKNDIRRSFAKMYLNAINCGDFQRLQDFSSTFVLPTCQFTASLWAKEEFRLPSFLHGVGPRTLVHHLLGCFVMFPDMVLTMGDTQVVTSNCWAGTQVIIPFDCRFTKTHHIPTECWVPPVDQVEQMYAEPSIERMMAALSVQDATSTNSALVAKKRKRAGLTPYDQVPPAYADRLLAGAAVVPSVPKLYAKGTYMIHLDERHHVQRIALDFSQLDDEV